MDEQQDYQSEDIVDADVVEEIYATNLNLPQFTEEGMAVVAASEDEPVNDGRRQFVMRLVMGGATALALGGSAALVYDRQRRQEPDVVILPNGTRVDSEEAIELINRINEVDYLLTSVTAERDSLISQLHDSQGEAGEAQAQLADAQAMLDEYRDVINLWQQMDGIGIDSILIGAISIVGSAFTQVSELVSSFKATFAAGKRKFDAFVEALPGPSDGIRWLGEQVIILFDNLESLATQMAEAIEPVEPLGTMVAEFVIWVLDRLPFGVGDRAKAGLEAMQDVVNALPDLIDGINDRVLSTLAEWFGEDDDQSLVGILINPLEESVFTPGGDVIDNFINFGQSFKDDLIKPVEEALAERQAIREELVEKQARLGLLA